MLSDSERKFRQIPHQNVGQLPLGVGAHGGAGIIPHLIVAIEEKLEG